MCEWEGLDFFLAKNRKVMPMSAKLIRLFKISAQVGFSIFDDAQRQLSTPARIYGVCFKPGNLMSRKLTIGAGRTPLNKYWLFCSRTKKFLDNKRPLLD